MIAEALVLVCYGVSSAGGGQARQRMDVEVVEEVVRVRLPTGIIYQIAGRGEADGWRTLNDVEISDREIRGRASLNWINRPLVVINRMTGTVDVTGGDVVGGPATFTGECERASERPLF
ncbi:hypothetical protein [Brevundimonas sp. TWP3-1-2b1]|uniref:hypothetical protein n=1 Tax=Brevundimonas sp. TWP3-1-2b1 TaxID=2804650 RepID=UPI003CEA1FF8